MDAPVTNEAQRELSLRAWFRFWCVLACALAWITGTVQVQADDQAASIGEGLRTVMEKRAFKIPSYWPGGPTKFCDQFLRDFRAQDNIKHLTPVLEAGTHEALPLQSLPAGCRVEDLFDTYQCEPRIADYIGTLPAGEQKTYTEKVCRRYRGTQNLRVYRADMDGNPSNGDELVTSFQRTVGPINKPERPQIFGRGHYKLLSGSTCEVLGDLQVHDPYDYLGQTDAKNYNGLIEYKKQFYVFDLFELAPKPGRAGAGPYSLTLNRYGPAKGERGPRFGTVCVFGESGTDPLSPARRQP